MQSLGTNPASFVWRILAPAFGVLAIGLVLAGWALSAIAARQDAEAAARTETLLRSNLQRHVEDVSRLLLDYSLWGEAYRNLHVSFDRGWAYDANNFGATLYHDFSIDYVAVVGADGATKYFVRGGQLASPEQFSGVLGRIGDLVKAARAQRETGKATTAIRDEAGVPTLFAAAPLGVGGDTQVQEIPGPPSVVVFGEAMNAPELGDFGSKALVKGLRSARDADDAARDPRLKIGDGDTPALTLRWTPYRPGAELLRDLLPWIALTASGLLACVCVVAGVARNAKRAIEKGARRLESAFRDAEFRALHDVATGLPNRAMLMQRLSTALSERHDIALIYIDLDNFKLINDTLGHPAGDFVLETAAARLQAVAAPDDLVCRVGGDEFVIVAFGASVERVEALCHDLLLTVPQPIDHPAHKLHVGLSIGVAFAPSDADRAEELVRLADIALYEAKAGGRRTHRFYTSRMSDSMAERAGMEHELARALDRDEFHLAFELVYDLRNMLPCQAAAAPRWLHPERGAIDAADFLPLAEQTGLLAPIVAGALASACRTVASCSEIGVSVAAPVEALRPGKLPEMVEEALIASGLAPHRLEIRVVDAAVIADPVAIRADLMSVRRLGAKLALEAQDGGCPSLGALKAFSFDVIRLGPGIVSELTATGLERMIVKALIGLAQSVGAQVSAAGVTASDQLLLLQFDQCSRVQGPLLSSLKSADELLDMTDVAVENAAVGQRPHCRNAVNLC